MQTCHIPKYGISIIQLATLIIRTSSHGNCSVVRRGYLNIKMTSMEQCIFLVWSDWGCRPCPTIVMSSSM